MDTTAQLVDDGVVTTDTATVPAGAAVISTSDNIPESTNNQTSTSTVTTTISSPLEITGVDVSPVVNTPFTGVVATFSDATDTNPNDFAVPGTVLTDYTATINWDNGQTSSGTVGVHRLQERHRHQREHRHPQPVHRDRDEYVCDIPAATRSASPSRTRNNNSATVNPTARVAYAPLVVTGAATINAVAGAQLSDVTVATFTDPGLVAALGTGSLSDLDDPVLGQHQLGRQQPG